MVCGLDPTLLYSKDALCQVCFLKYAEVKEKTVLGISFPCFHSVCPACDKDLTSYTKLCPTCHGQIYNPLKQEETSPISLNSKTIILQTEIRSQMDKLSNKIKDINLLKPDLVNHSYILKYWEGVDKNNPSRITGINRNIDAMKKILVEVEIGICNISEPFLKPDFALRNYKTKEEFINQLAVKVYMGVEIFALHSHWRKSTVYLGKLSFKSGKLCISSFTKKIPYNPILYVMFSDLRKCMSLDNFGTFIDLSGELFFCRMLTLSGLTSEFIKICSGEDGKSLKNRRANQNRSRDSDIEELIIELEKPNSESTIEMEKKVIPNYHFLHTLPSKTTKKFQENERQIRITQGNFNVLKLVEGKNISNSVNKISGFIIGVSETPPECSRGKYTLVNNKPGLEVKDCGIFIQI